MTVSADEVDLLLEACNNWRRWGPSDTLGTLNLISSQTVASAGSLVRDGRTVGMSRVIGGAGPKYRGASPLHLMMEVPDDSGAGPRGTSSDWLGLAPHGFAVTHLDALCHQSWRGRLYGDRATASVSTRAGARMLNLEPFADGLFVPAVLLDIPAALDRPWLDPGEEIDLGLLDRAIRRSGDRPAPGEALIVRTGRDAREQALGGHDPIEDGNPGLSAAVSGWLAETSPSVIVTDVQADAMKPAGHPHLMPIHIVCLVGLGIHLVDNAQLDELAALCALSQRWRFAFALAPLNIKHATGSPVSPVAIL
jgi:kynurenine formamidase